MEKKLLKKIDAHAHAVLRDIYPKHDLENLRALPTGEKIIEMYDRLGVEKGMLMPLLNPEFHSFLTTTEIVMEICENHPDRFFFACGLDPRMMKHSTSSDFGKLIEWYKAKGAKAVGEIEANMPFDDPLFDNLFSHCEEQDMSITIHLSPYQGYAYGLVDDPGLPGLEKCLKKHPKLKIIGHSQAFWANMSADVTSELMKGYPRGKLNGKGAVWHLLENYENMYCDLSAGSGYNAVSRDEEMGFEFIEKYQDKILFGLDICTEIDPCHLPGWLDKHYLAGNISESAYRKICRENAIKMFKLEDKA